MEARQHREGPEVTLLYVRPRGPERTELDRKVEAIAGRYARSVVLRVVSPDDLAGGAGQAAGAPALLLLRHGAVVGQAVGALLPARELDDVVRRAVEWPAPAP